MWGKKKVPPKCDRRTVTYDVGTAQCDDEIDKCVKKIKGTTECDKSTVTWYWYYIM